MPAGAGALWDPDARIVIGHRGNRVAAPENTLESLKQAIELGADAVEFDVRMTRDAVAVVMHDARLDRTTSGHGLLSAYSLEEIRTLDAAAFAPAPAGRRLLVPTLEEVLDTFRETPLVIEVKELGAVTATREMIRRFGAEGRVLIGSSNNRVMESFYGSGVRTCASVKDATRTLFTGRIPARRQYDVLSLTPTFYGLPVPVGLMIAAARKAGVATQVWTVNDPVRAKSLWMLGVAGIVTDDPRAPLRARAE
jgi:glycerophosphoryl diester phosphodiesterase